MKIILLSTAIFLSLPMLLVAITEIQSFFESSEMRAKRMAQLHKEHKYLRKHYKIVGKKLVKKNYEKNI